tara:strand:+ start:9433 stop:10371 length:939 start_codon:yes stop_codon:yes gene_type:complete
MGQSIVYGQKYRSPLRVDNKPSLAFYPPNGRYTASCFDFSNSTKPTRVVNFIGELLKIKDYKEICTQINRDLEIGLLDLEPEFKTIRFDGYDGEVDLSDKSHITLAAMCITQSFTKRDRLFWGSFGISLPTLEFFNVYSTSKVIMPVGDNILYRNSCPIYTYHFGGPSKKIYLPTRRTGSRFFNYGEVVVQGIKQIPEKGDLIIITKSLKDVMLLYEMGYTSIAPNSETHGLDINLINDLKKRFKLVVLFFDNDEPGLKATKIFSEIYEIPSILMEKEQSKDISDYFYKTKSIEACKKIIKNLIDSIEIDLS